MGNRVWTDSSIRGTKRFIVDIVGGLPVILCEVDQATGSLEKSYIYADGQILSQVSHGAQSTDVYYYVHDRLGSVRMVVGYDGQTVSVANGYAYRPFGAFYEGECVETVDSPFCFTGQWRDGEIDQYDLRARQYDPAMMRFMTRDPVRGKMREPLTLHCYLYCWNDPSNLVDLTGKSPSPTSEVIANVTARVMLGGVIGANVGVVFGLVNQFYDMANGQEFDAWEFTRDVLACALGGAISGGVAAGFQGSAGALEITGKMFAQDVAMAIASGTGTSLANWLVGKAETASKGVAGIQMQNIMHQGAILILAEVLFE